MKTKFLAAFITFAMLCPNLSYASPTVTRDYITKKSGKKVHCEENLSVNYSNLRLEQGDCVIMSFFDIKHNLLKELILDLNVSSLSKDKIFIESDLLNGTAYIEIELIGPEPGYDGIILPLNINI